MSDISGGLIESLKTLGLTEYEAKVYSALVMYDRAEVKQVYEYLDAPKPSVYQSLRSLTDKGLVQVVSSKPAIYRATPPKIAVRHMTDAHRKAGDRARRELEALAKSRAEGDYPDVLWTLYGEENIEHKMEELLDRAQRSMTMVLPQDHLHYLDTLRGRDIPVQLLVFGSGAKAEAEACGLPGLQARDAFTIDMSDMQMLLKYFASFPLPPDRIDRFLLVGIDGEEFMYIPPIPGPVPSGITSRNQFVLALIDTIFRILWDRTR